jgi:hypothetical protein
MRPSPLLLAALLTASSWTIASEPPSRLRVEIDGQPFMVTAGDATTIDLGGRTATLRVTEQPWKRFAEGGLAFEYPRHFPWQYDPSPPRSWTLDGTDAVIMVFDNDVPSPRTAEQLANDTERLLEPKTPPERATAVLRTGRAGTVTGVASTVVLKTMTLSHEVFALSSSHGNWLLALQDTLDDDGAHSAEYLEMRTRLSATLEF